MKVILTVTTEAQKRASAKYQREKTRQVNLKFSQRETELYDWLAAQDGSMSGAIKRLIRQAMRSESVYFNQNNTFLLKDTSRKEGAFA